MSEQSDWISDVEDVIGLAIMPLNVLFGIMAASEVVNVTTGDTSQYPFGWEGGGFTYSSPEAYVLVMGSSFMIAAAFTAGFLVRKRHRAMYHVLTDVWVVGVFVNLFLL